MINRGRFHSAAVGCRFAAIAVTSDEITQREHPRKRAGPLPLAEAMRECAGRSTRPRMPFMFTPSAKAPPPLAIAVVDM